MQETEKKEVAMLTDTNASAESREPKYSSSSFIHTQSQEHGETVQITFRVQSANHYPKEPLVTF